MKRREEKQRGQDEMRDRWRMREDTDREEDGRGKEVKGQDKVGWEEGGEKRRGEQGSEGSEERREDD